jgi:hypothetical protein
LRVVGVDRDRDIGGRAVEAAARDAAWVVADDRVVRREEIADG